MQLQKNNRFGLGTFEKKCTQAALNVKCVKISVRFYSQNRKKCKITPENEFFAHSSFKKC